MFKRCWKVLELIAIDEAYVETLNCVELYREFLQVAALQGVTLMDELFHSFSRIFDWDRR